MSEFKREHRYHVIKLAKLPPYQYDQLRKLLIHWSQQGLDPTVEAVVVEHDWPIYEQTWEAVQRLAEERAQELDELREERDALAAHVERQSDLLRRLVSAMRNYEMDADPDYPPPRDHRAMMSDAEAGLEAAPETSLARLIAENRIEGALAVRHLTQGDDWEDTELRAVIEDYVAGLRRQSEAQP